jgi:hypothetical protein
MTTVQQTKATVQRAKTDTTDLWPSGHTRAQGARNDDGPQPGPVVND